VRHFVEDHADAWPKVLDDEGQNGRSAISAARNEERTWNCETSCDILFARGWCKSYVIKLRRRIGCHDVRYATDPTRTALELWLAAAA
jgi:dTDP-D-glucose 4,6-dehydratase